MARKLIVEILGDSKSLERSFTRSSAAANKFGRDIDTGVGKAEARFSKFQKVAAGGFVGGLIAQQAVQAIRSVVVAASESQQVLGQTKVALEATGKSWNDYGKQIQDTVKAQSQLGFDDEALLRTFSLFQRQTGDVTQALKENNLAMDVARARFIDLEQAANLVNKAALGQAGALRRLGIDTKGATSGTELLTLLTQKYGGAAQAASKDASTALDRVAVATENAKESIGTLLLPAVVKMSDALVDAANASQALVAGLQKIADFPVIHKIITFEVVPQKGGKKGEGISVGDLFTSNIFDIGKLGVDAVRGTGPFAEKDKFNENAAAKIFASRFDTFIESLHKGQKKAAAGAKNKAKAKGFGAGLTPADLFGPLIKGVTPAQEEALLDAQLSGNQKRLRAVLVGVQSSLTKAIDDPRLKAVGRRGVKDALLGIKNQIDAIDADVAAGIKAANERRTVRLNKVEQNAKTAAAKHKAKLKEIAKHQAEVNKAAREAAKAQVQASQFRAIGLSPEGGERVPTIANLQKQLGQISDHDVSQKVRSQLKNVGKVLRGDFGKVTEQTRAAIKELFATIRGTFDEESKKDVVGPLTKGNQSLNVGKILAGLGLGRDTEKELRARLSSFNSQGKSLAGASRPTGSFGGGTFAQRDVVVNLTTMLDGQVVAQSTSKHQVASARRNPWQKRGPNRSVWGF